MTAVSAYLGRLMFWRSFTAGKGKKLFNASERLSAARCMFCDNVFARSKVRPIVVESQPGDEHPQEVFGCETCCRDMGSANPVQDRWDKKDE